MPVLHTLLNQVWDSPSKHPGSQWDQPWFHISAPSNPKQGREVKLRNSPESSDLPKLASGQGINPKYKSSQFKVGCSFSNLILLPFIILFTKHTSPL